MPLHNPRPRARFIASLLVALTAPLLLAEPLNGNPNQRPTAPAQAASARLDGKTAAERGAALVRYVASCKPSQKDETYPKASAPAYAARLLLGIETEYAREKLDAAVSACIAKRGKGTPLDPFDKVALVNTYFLAKDQIPPATVSKIREYVALYGHQVWRGYGAWNYRLMMDGAGYLAAEEWPDLKDADGLDSEGIRKATRERLLGYFNDIAKKNYSEFGCPIYSAVNLSAIRMLAEFAKDPEIAERATLTLDAMLVDIACTWNQGYNVGTAARAKYWGSTDTSLESMMSTAAAAWVWFGAPRSIAAAGTGWIHSFWMATPGRYKLPDLIADIANDRGKPVVYQGFIAGMPRQNVHRTTFHSQNFSLCSQWDHPSGPTDALYKEGRRNMLKWVSDSPSSTFAVCMENPQRPYALKENKANALGYGENPFSQYLQHNGVLLGIYSVPADYPYYKLYAPFTKRGAIVKRIEKDGWVFCHNGSMLMAFHSAQPCAWQAKPWGQNDMLWCEARNNGWVLETSELTPFAGGGVEKELERFADAILAKTRFSFQEDKLTLTYQSLTGDQLEINWLPHKTPYTGQSLVNGKPVDYKSWPIHDSPWVHQTLNPPVLALQHAGKTLTYDFEHWTRK